MGSRSWLFGTRRNRGVSRPPGLSNNLLVMVVTADELLTGNNSFGREAA